MEAPLRAAQPWGVPNGSSVGSEKYDYKLGWLKALHGFVEGELKVHENLVVLGDFNIAPDDRDVYDPEKWGDGILCSPAEREALQGLVDLGLSDVYRQFDQPERVERTEKLERVVLLSSRLHLRVSD